MSLLDDLRVLADQIDTQFLPATGEVQKILGALIHFTEHGDELVKAGDENGVEGTTQVLAPPVEDEAPKAPAAAEPADRPPLSDQELEAQIRDLQSQLASRQATSQQTVVEHETGGQG